MNIEYLEEFYELQDKDSFKGQQWFGDRKELVEKYSWAVPTEDVIQYCAEFDDLLEVGAGNGYWAHLIEEAGGDVTAVDANPTEDTYTTVEAKNIVRPTLVESDSVLMVWPPYGKRMAETVAQSSPNHILYVGEGRGGCTGNDGFFDIVEEQYGLVGKLDIPSYVGIHDNFFHYSRKI